MDAVPAVWCSTCVAWHHPRLKFYVTFINGVTRKAVAGPFTKHEDAVAAMPEAQKRLEEIDPYSYFYGWGTGSK